VRPSESSGGFFCVSILLADAVLPEGELCVVGEVEGEGGDGDVAFEEKVDIGACVCGAELEAVGG